MTRFNRGIAGAFGALLLAGGIGHGIDPEGALGSLTIVSVCTGAGILGFLFGSSDDG